MAKVKGHENLDIWECMPAKSCIEVLSLRSPCQDHGDPREKNGDEGGNISLWNTDCLGPDLKAKKKKKKIRRLIEKKN